MGGGNGIIQTQNCEPKEVQAARNKIWIGRNTMSEDDMLELEGMVASKKYVKRSHRCFGNKKSFDVRGHTMFYLNSMVSDDIKLKLLDIARQACETQGWTRFDSTSMHHRCIEYITYNPLD